MQDSQTSKETSVPSFGEVYGKRYAFPGVRVVLAAILGREIIIKEYVKRTSKYEGRGEIAIVHGESKEINPAEPYDFSFITGSKVLMEQLERTKDKLPYRTKIVKKKSYFSFE